MVQLYRYLSYFLVGAVCLSCSEENPKFGTSFISENAIQFDKVDSLTMNFSTIKFDTLITSLSPSNNNELLIGLTNNLDQRPGDVSAIPFFQMSINNPEDINLNDAGLEYDSMVFSAVFNGYNIGDSSKDVTYSIHQLSETIEFDEDEFDFFNVSSVGFDATNSLGQTTLKPRTQSLDTIKIKLDDAFGQSIFEEFRQQTLNTETSLTVQDFLKGFVLRSIQTHDFAAGIDASSIRMRLYYTNTRSENPTTSQLVFNFNPANADNRIRDIYFTSYETDFSDSPVQLLTEQSDEISSATTNNIAFIAGARGLGVKIDFPYFYQFAQQLEGRFLNAVTLSLKPDFLRNIDPTVRLNTLRLFKIDKNNDILLQYTNAQLVYDPELRTNTEYIADITSFFEEQLEDRVDNENALLLVLSTDALNETMESLILGDQRNERLNSKISINLIKQKNE